MADQSTTPPYNPKERSPQEILKALNHLMKNHKKSKELLADAQKRQDTFVSIEQKIAELVLSIDRQEKRINNQMNFMKRTIEDIYSKLDSVKMLQDTIDEEMKKVGSIQLIIADEFAALKDEVGLGNKETITEVGALCSELVALRKGNEKVMHSMNEIAKQLGDEITKIKNQFEEMKQAIIKELPRKLRKAFGQPDPEDETNSSSLSSNGQ